MWKAGLWSITILALAHAACREQASSPSTPPSSSCDSPMELRNLEQEILARIGTPSCQQPSQCRSVAFGAKPCGGPWRYLVYSTATVAPEAVEQRVSEYNDVNGRLNEVCGWVSDCAFVLEPLLDCREGVCVAAE